ncbi:hypothetical protein [Micromonospora sp. NPDC050200]|uniref:hypothetical protein n=1 Tax=Micromonospora sp. NPDC050200 TaxID=3155664 RepID=UPI00340FEC2C
MVQQSGQECPVGWFEPDSWRRVRVRSVRAVADRVLTGQASELLAELSDGPNGQRWAEHFIRAEQHCSPGLKTAAEPHVARYRKWPPIGRGSARTGTDPAAGTTKGALHRSLSLRSVHQSSEERNAASWRTRPGRSRE